MKVTPVSPKGMNHVINDGAESRSQQVEPEHVRLPGRQSGLDTLGQRAGGRGFTELLLRSGQRSQHAH